MSSPTPPASGQGPVANPSPFPLPPLLRRLLLAAGALVLLASLFGAWGIWATLIDDDGRPTVAQVRALQGQVDALEQRTATLARSDQITRDANRDLQGALAARDEEIAGLRADVAFYERFVGPNAQRRGLAVHELRLVAQTDQAWQFTATLTQSVNRDADNSGQLRISVEGTRSGRLQRLEWPQLRQQADAPGVPYSFKYFQQVQGDLVLPQDFQPVRIIATLVPARGTAVEQSFPWTVAVGREGTGGA